MTANASIIRIYANADPSEKVDIICKHYSNFIGIVDGYTDGLRYMIENEKSYNQKDLLGDPGIRVHTLGQYNDTTSESAIKNITVREALIRCDFSEGILEGIDNQEEIQRKALLLRGMRNDYKLFNSQLRILTERDYRLFERYLKGELDIAGIAQAQGIQYESAIQKLYRVKKKIKIQMIGFLQGNQ